MKNPTVTRSWAKQRDSPEQFNERQYKVDEPIKHKSEKISRDTNFSKKVGFHGNIKR